MPRPKRHRCLRFNPTVLFFKPKGIPVKNLFVTDLFPDELEALKISFADDLDQIKGAFLMGISQPTFARLLSSATKKVCLAIIKGHAISIHKSNNICYGKH